jgi:mannan endo-1,4-beta-mannosidase
MMSITRREGLLGGAALLGGCATGLGGGKADRFVRVSGTRFTRGGRAWRFAGSNMWYAGYLGADAPVGDRGRLRRELDRLAALGVTNLRILASSEHSPLKNSIRPAFNDKNGAANETLLRGLDFALAEMARRDMTAVLYLNNFWEWSGGMATYLYWTNGGRYLDMNDPAHPWPEFPDFTSGFYESPEAVALSHAWLRRVVERVNTVTGRAYRDDPAIMAWQLANEPRPGGSDAVANRRVPAFRAWVEATARLIRSLDPNHLVSTGSEGLKGCVESAQCVLDEHAIPGIDYVTTHIWPLNWSWVDSADLAGTWAGGEAKVRQYIAQHIDLAGRLGKPLVFEEFGFPRDGGSFDPAASTIWKDRFYRLIYTAVLDDAARGGPLAGSNFWAWGGEGRAAHADHRFQRGDRAYLGDPPHEPQGWYSVFDSDESTRGIIRDHAAALERLPA